MINNISNSFVSKNNYCQSKNYDNSYFKSKSKEFTEASFTEDVKNNIDENSDNISKVNRDEGITFFGFNGDTDFARIYRAENYSSDNPVYVIEGSANGKKYTTYMNVNDVDPRNASLVEMGILHTHLCLTGEIPKGFDSFNCGYYKKVSMYDKKDYLSYMKWLTDCQLSSNNMIMYSILNTQYKAYSKYC